MAAPSTTADASGELVNPHIPEFMAKAPWYLNQGTDKGLAHQRRGEVEDQSISNLEKYYAHRGQKVGTANGFRKGACKNCGSATHNEKQCTERPRKVGAWKSGSGIAADEALPAHLRLGWDAKRDRYAGFDSDEHAKVVARYEAIEKERLRLKEEERKKAEEEAARKQQEKEQRRVAKQAARAERKAAKAAGSSGVDEDAATASDVSSDSEDGSTDSDFSSSEDEGAGRAGRGRDAAGAGEADGAGAGEGEGGSRRRSGSKDSHGSGGSSGSGGGGTNAKMVSWNVRTREDTAKYLLNLDTESAFYDPKTRSMRENPFAPGDPRAALYGYSGDNAVKGSGAVSEMAADQMFAWEAYNRGTDVHLQANPTQVALLKQQFAQRKEAVKALVAKKLADKYGGSAAGADADVEQGDALPAELRLAGVAESERYREYVPALAPDGRVVPVAIEPGRSGAGAGASSAAGPSSGPSGSSAAGAGSASSSSGPVRSKYPEDQYPGNHTSIYGSWFDRESKNWGFACCHQTMYGSYCTGEAGKRARADAADFASRAAVQHAEAAAERAAVAVKRRAEVDEAARAEAVAEDERARKRSRLGDPTSSSSSSAGAAEASGAGRGTSAGMTGYAARDADGEEYYS